MLYGIKNAVPLMRTRLFCRFQAEDFVEASGRISLLPEELPSTRCVLHTRVDAKCWRFEPLVVEGRGGGGGGGGGGRGIFACTFTD